MDVPLETGSWQKQSSRMQPSQTARYLSGRPPLAISDTRTELEMRAASRWEGHWVVWGSEWGSAHSIWDVSHSKRRSLKSSRLNGQLGVTAHDCYFRTTIPPSDHSRLTLRKRGINRPVHQTGSLLFEPRFHNTASARQRRGQPVLIHNSLLRISTRTLLRPFRNRSPHDIDRMQSDRFVSCGSVNEPARAAPVLRSSCPC